MTISSYEALDVRFELCSEEEIANISQTLKVEEKKMSLVFYLTLFRGGAKTPSGIFFVKF